MEIVTVGSQLLDQHLNMTTVGCDKAILIPATIPIMAIPLTPVLSIVVGLIKDCIYQVEIDDNAVAT